MNRDEEESLQAWVLLLVGLVLAVYLVLRPEEPSCADLGGVMVQEELQVYQQYSIEVCVGPDGEVL